MIKDYDIDNSTNDKKEYIILICLTLIVFLIHIMHIRDIGIIYILDDEYGYWGNAAYLSGLNWSNTVSKIPYYSYGYSLLLVPLFWIFDSTIYMYKAAIVLNGIMLSISFWLCYDIARKLMNNVNKYLLISISFLISMYPTYIVYSHIAWSECLLMFVFWLLIWCFAGLNEKTSVNKFVLIGFLSGYIYIIHQRTLGILIASITVVLIMKIFKKINIKQLFSYTLPIILLMLIGFKLKNNIQNNLWLMGTEISINDYSGQIGKINQIISIDGLVKLFKVFIGQFFYLGVASFLMFYFGLYELIQNTGKTIISAFKSRTSSILNTDEKFYVYIFLLIAVSITMAISAIFFINPIKINEIVFGRYNEIVLGPIMLLGFSSFLNKEKLSLKNFLTIFFCFSVLVIISSLIINVSGLVDYQTVDIVGLLSLQNPYGIYISAFFGMMVFRIAWISISSRNKNTIIVTLIVISSFCFAFGEVRVKSLATQNQEALKILEVVDIINSTEESLPIYFLIKDPNNSSSVEWNNRTIRDRSVADCYQFVLKDKTIIAVNDEELSKILGDKFVITTKNIDLTYFMNDYELSLCGSDDGSYLFISK